MTGVQIIIGLLHGHAPLLAVVPKAAIEAGALRQGEALPAIRVTTVSATEQPVLKVGQRRRVAHRVQVDVMAATYRQQIHIIALVRKACSDWRGSLDAVANIAVQADVTGPDMLVDEPRTFIQSQDFQVGFTVPA